MQIDQLRYFLESYKRKNFTKTAEHLFVTPQAVSRSVIELENELNLTLFERRGEQNTADTVRRLPGRFS